jgi:hypothetical protein
MLKKILFIPLSFWLVTSCQKGQPKTKPNVSNKEVITPDDIKTITNEETKMYHKVLKNDYEYQTETTGNNEYNYLVNGLDQVGDSVSGVINIKGKYGAGTIINIDKETVDIEVEWIDYDKLKGTDEDGNIYKLETN